jgi:hypothetical protein
MNLTFRRLIRFALTFVPLFAIFFAGYMTLVKHYEPIVVGSANLVTGRMNPPTVLQIEEHRNWTGYVFDPNRGKQRIKAWKSATRQLILLSLVSVPSLLLATPTTWRRRFRWMLIAIPLIYLGHILAAVILTRAQYCLGQTPDAWFCRWAKSFAVTSGQMMAGFLWFGLTWRFWFEREDPDVAQAPRATDTGARVE